MPSPAQLPDAHGVAGGGVERGARGVQGDLVDLVLALHAGHCPRGGPCTGIPRDHLPRRSKGRRSSKGEDESRAIEGAQEGVGSRVAELGHTLRKVIPVFVVTMGSTRVLSHRSVPGLQRLT